MPNSRWEKRGGAIDYASPQCSLLSNGAYNIMLTESGISSASSSDTLIYRTPFKQTGEGHGAEITLTLGGRVRSLLPSPDENGAYMWEFSEISAEFSCVYDELTARTSVAVSGAENGEARTVSVLQNRISTVQALNFRSRPCSPTLQIMLTILPTGGSASKRGATKTASRCTVCRAEARPSVGCALPAISQ